MDYCIPNNCVLSIKTTQEVWTQSVKLKSDSLWLQSVKESLSFPSILCWSSRQTMFLVLVWRGEMIAGERPVSHKLGVSLCSLLPNNPPKQALSTQKIPSRGTDFWVLFPSVDSLTSKKFLGLVCLQMHLWRLSIIIREMNMKTTMGYHITSHWSEWLSSINQQASVGEDVEKGEPSCTIGGNADWCGHCGKHYKATSKN